MHSEVNRLLDTFPGSWPRFLNSVKIDGLRGWKGGPEINFNFPVCVITGENGSGKSTILKAAAAAYLHPTDTKKSFYPDDFFPSTTWESISGVTLDYKITEGDSQRFQRITKPTKRWYFGRLKRPRRYVFWHDVSRTLPIGSTVGYGRIAQQNAIETSSTILSDNVLKYYSSVLGRSYQEVKVATNAIDKK